LYIKKLSRAVRARGKQLEKNETPLKSAESESVQLRAQRAILLDQITLAKHANLKYRMSPIIAKM